jgi:formimidoylglutamate deiminase
MYKFVDALTPEQVEAIAALSQIEMMESGYACVGEFHYLHHQNGGRPYDDPAELSRRIIAAAGETGIGLTLLPVFYSQGGIDGRALEGGPLRFRNDLDGFAVIWSGARRAIEKLGEDHALGIAPHSLRAVSKFDLNQLAEAYPQGPIHIHIAEQAAEIEEVTTAYGLPPIAWLFANAAVDNNWCLVHATHMNDDEITLLASSGAVVGLCPVTEANLGDGIFPANEFLNRGGSIGLGTDSNIAIDLVQEMRTLEYSQRLRDQARSVLCENEKSTGRYLFDEICRGGAQATGRHNGKIAPGAWADFMALDGNALSIAGLKEDRLLDAWVFASKGQMVSDVWSAGRHMVKEGRHINRHGIEKRFRKTMRELRNLL